MLMPRIFPHFTPGLAALLVALACSVPPLPARGDDGFSIPGLGVVRADDIKAPEVSEQELEQDMRSLEEAFGAPKPAVSVEGGVASYTGEVNAAGFDALAAIAAGGDVSALSVDSLGGEVFWGMKIGELVFAGGWEVRVRGICFSSCANYIFPAGKRKIIDAGAIVGWHGSARQDAVLAARAGISEEQEFLRKIVPAMLAGLADSGQDAPGREMMLEGIASELGRHRTRRRMETAFFERIGVHSDSAVYGFLPESGVPETSGGWTYRIPDLAQFGITNVEYLGPGDYPPPDKLALLGLSIATLNR